MGLKSLNRESYPAIELAKAFVTTVYPGSSPEEVEEKITKKIEDEIRTVSGVKDVRSVSQSGLSKIFIRVDMDNANTKEVMGELQRAVEKTDGLPDGILEDPSFDTLSSSEFPVIEVGVTGSNKGRARDRVAHDLKSLLEDVKGVAEVRYLGFKNREFQILLNQKKMDQHHVGIQEVFLAVKKRTQNIPAGYIKNSKNQMLVRVQGQVHSAAEMGDIVVRSNFENKKVLVSDIATVVDGDEESSILTSIDGSQSTLLTVIKKSTSDAVSTATLVINKINEFERTLKPGYKLTVYRDESVKVSNKLSIVVNNALTGMVLVLLIMFLFLPGKMGLVAAISLPVSVMATIGFISLLGVTLNTVTMLALVISIGMLVDNAVVISENYARLRQSGLDNFNAALRGAHQFWVPISLTVATTMASFAPMLVTKGIMGQFVKFIPIVVIVSLSVSLFESFFLLPARLQFTLKSTQKEGNKRADNWFSKFRVLFEKFMIIAVKKRYTVLVSFTLLLVSSLLLAVFGNRFELFPSEGIDYYFARYETPVSTSLEETQLRGDMLVKEINKKLGNKLVKNQVLQVGFQKTGFTDPNEKSGDNVGMVTVVIHPEVAETLNVQSVLKKLREIKKGSLKSLSFEQKVNGPPIGKPINVTFRSNNRVHLNELVSELKDSLVKIDGIVDVQDDVILGGKEYQIQLDYSMLSRLGLSTEDIGVAIRTALQGAVASELNMDNEDFDLRIKYNKVDRANIDSLKRAKVMTKTGRLIPLSSVAKVVEVQGPSVKKHLDFQPSITVTAEVIPEVITSILANNRTLEVFTGLKEKYPSVTVYFGGEQESTKESIESLFKAMGLAIFGIFTILLILFSFTESFLVLSSIPLGLVGVSFAFFVHGKPLGFFALIGVVGLAGVVVNSAIVLMSYIKDLKNEDSNQENLLAKASANRLRAVLVTSLTTVGGLMPTAYGFGGHDPILVPMTLALAWGLASGTILTLIWVPCAYAIIDDVKCLFLKMRNQRSKSY